MSLERLIELAKKTGDTLIVHDEDGRDLVIMDVARYEMLVDKTSVGLDSQSEPTAWENWERDDIGLYDDFAKEDSDIFPEMDNLGWSSTRDVIDEKKDDFDSWGGHDSWSEDNNKGISLNVPENKNEAGIMNEWDDETLGEDEPVFYEEPV